MVLLSEPPALSSWSLGFSQELLCGFALTSLCEALQKLMLEQNEVRHIDIHRIHRHHPQILKRDSFHFRIPDSCTPPFQHDSSNTGYCKTWTLDRFWACISFSAEKIIRSYEYVQSGHEAVVQGPTGDLLEHGTAWRQSVFWILKSSKWASKILNASLRSPRGHVD